MRKMEKYKLTAVGPRWEVVSSFGSHGLYGTYRTAQRLAETLPRYLRAQIVDTFTKEQAQAADPRGK